MGRNLATVANTLHPGRSYTNPDVAWLRATAGSYIKEGVDAYRLFHQSLVEHLRHGRDPTSTNPASTG